MPRSDDARRAIAALRNVLPRTAKVRTGTSPGEVVINGLPLKVAWAGHGWLRDVSGLAARRCPRLDVVAARRISPGAAKVLADAGIGFVDETGAAEIAVASLIVSRTGHPAGGPEKAQRWTPSALAVAEALLCGTKPTVSAVRDAVGLSAGACTRALGFFTDLGLLTADARRGRGSGRRLTDSARLLDEYASAASSMPARTSLQMGVTWRDPVEGLIEIGLSWDKEGIAWAATGALAALVIAPHLTSVRSAEVYVEATTLAGLASVGEAAGLRPIRGGRLTLRPFATVAIPRFATLAKDLRVASWPRVYADLRPLGVRGEEAAEHLREVMGG